jgi:hypothetical protein
MFNKAVYMRAYNHRPEVKAKRWTYRHSPKGRAKQTAYMRAYLKRPEIQLRILKNPEWKVKRASYCRTYEQSQKGKQKRRAWRQRPEGKTLKARERTRRRQLGFIPLNKKFKGSEGHHIDTQNIVFVPKELHRSVPHRLSDLRTMKKINEKVWNFLGVAHNKQEGIGYGRGNG